MSVKALKYWGAVRDNPADFTSWTCLLQTVDQENVLASAREAYDAFFKYYPYCYGYWKKYADLEKKHGNADIAEQIFQRGIKAISLSIDLWVHYLNFHSQNTKGQPDGSDSMRRLFKEAIETAGLEFRSDKLWDLYIDWEKAQGNLQNVTAIYDHLFTTPTQQYQKHFEKFNEHINSHKPSEILTEEEYLELRAQVASIPPGVTASDEIKEATDIADMTAGPPGVDDSVPEAIVDPMTEGGGPPGEETEDQYTLKDVDEEEIQTEKRNEEEAMLVMEKIISTRGQLYQKNEETIKKIWHFEDTIKRPYFHVKPLERVQLKNWRDYLDFEISQGDHKRICVLFERCLIACALYEDFWQKYITYLESISVAETRHAYERACTIHLTKKTNINLNWAAFEELHGNGEEASGILKRLDENLPGLVLLTVRRAGLERRHNNFEEAVKIFKNAISKTDSVDEKTFFSIKCARLYSKIIRKKEEARAILHDALENDRANKRIYLQLLDIEFSTGEIEEDKCDELFNLVQETEELTPEFKQGFSQRRLEILEDFGKDIDKIMKCFESHQKQFKIKSQIIAAKKRPQEESDDTKNKVAKTEESQVNNIGSTEATPYTTSDPTAVSSAYAYNPTLAGQWQAYAAQAGAGSYYGWYNPYAYTQQPSQ